MALARGYAMARHRLAPVTRTYYKKNTRITLVFYALNLMFYNSLQSGNPKSELGKECRPRSDIVECNV